MVGRGYNGSSRAEQGVREGLRALPVRFGGVRCGYEVGDGSDRLVPPVSEMGRGTRSSAAAARWRARLTGRSSVGREAGLRGKERREGEEGSRPRGEGGKKNGPSPRAARERDKFFSFLFSVSLFF